MRKRFPVRAVLALGLALMAGRSGGGQSNEAAGAQAPKWQSDKNRTKLLDIDEGVELAPQVWPATPGDTDWPSYNNRLDGNRYTELSEMNTDNIDALEEACRVVVSGAGPFSAGSILVDGVIYTTAWRATLAIHPVNCEIIWKSNYSPEEGEVYNANRGVAYLAGTIYRGTGDGRLLAYDAATGRELWRKKIADPGNAEYLVAAPIAWEGKVFIGLAGGDFGIVGRMMAFDAKTGDPVWSFNTIPVAGEYGNDTWPGDTWKTGGGGTWSSFTLDIKTKELFVPVANPAPDFDARVRRGDNLFTNSVIALDALTGKRIWHFQARKNDNHDYGVASPAVLLDIGARRAVAQASKDGFLYLIDRNTHQLIWKTAVTTLLNNDADATTEGVKICPGAKGGVSYNSPGYDPKYGLLIVGSVDWCYKLFKEPYEAHVPGNPYLGGRMGRADDAGTGWITAVDARTGSIKWRYHAPAPVIAGITPTAGAITLAGDAAGNLYVFRTKDGKLLRQINTGGALAGGVITYRIRNRQYLAVNSGNISRSAWGASGGTPTLIVYRLPEPTKKPEENLDALTPNLSHGRTVYQTSCSVCHGMSGQGAEAPKLTGLTAKYTQAQTAAYIANPKQPMPKLYPGALSAQDVVDVAAYTLSLTTQ